MSVEDRIVEVQVELLRLEAGSRRAVLALFDDLRDEIIRLLTSRDVTGSPRPGVQQARLRALLSDLDEVLRVGYQQIGQKLSDDLAAIAGHTASKATTAVNSVIGGEIITPQITKATLRTVAKETLVDGAPVREWLDIQSRRMREKFLREMRKGMVSQESVGQLVGRLVGNKDHPGIMRASRREAEALVRTSVISISNQARIKAYFDSPGVKGLRWVSTLDDRTTPICRALDGLTWDENLQPVGHKFPFPGPTAHWNCRSTQVPVLEDWATVVKSKRVADMLTEWEQNRARASKQGPVKASTTYGDWLRRQPVDVQKSVLGVGKWELWRKGKLSFADMVDQSGRPLRLDELGIR